jgi:hypothetical protein
LAASWFFAVAARERYFRLLPSSTPIQRWLRSGLNLILILWTVSVAFILFNAVRVGLLGYPDMMISGNGSTQALLRWYQDRYPDQTTTAWFLSMPVLAYRLLMLVWALWLAASLLQWTKWAWECLGRGGAGHAAQE